MPLACSIEWWWPAGYGEWSDLFTVVAAFVGGAAAAVAVVTYRQAASAAAAAHMHGLFRCYLQERLSFIREGKDPAVWEMISFKLYTLEEMVIWLERQKKFTWGAPKLDNVSIAAWDASIDSHLRDDGDTYDAKDQTLRSIRTFAACYGNPFLLRAAKILSAPDLKKWVDDGRPKDRTPWHYIPPEQRTPITPSEIGSAKL